MLRLLNSTVQICPEGEFGLSPLSSRRPETGADSRGDLNAYIFILTTLGETDVRLSLGAHSESAAFFFAVALFRFMGSLEVMCVLRVLIEPKLRNLDFCLLNIKCRAKFPENQV